MAHSDDAQHTISIHGIELHYTVRGTGEPLLLLHGFTGSSADWVHMFDLDALARSYTVITPDLRGHGGSTNPSGRFTHRQCADDVEALLDHLGVECCRALGTSAGGNTLLHLATRDRERVSAMVLFGAPSYYPAQARTIMQSMTVETRSEQEWALMRARHRHGDDQIRALWNAARGFAESHDDMCFTPPLLATIRARTLIVAGDRDPLYPVDIFVEQYHAIPNASLMVLPDAGHESIWADARDAFVKTALAFLSRQ